MKFMKSNIIIIKKNIGRSDKMQQTDKMVSLGQNKFYQKEFFLYFPKRDEILLLETKTIVRRIFEGQVEFEPNEIEMLFKFDDFLKDNQFKEFHKWSEPQKLRMLYATKFKFDKSLQIMNTYMQWKEISLPPRETPEAIDFLVLQSGAIYVHGRDNRFRPILVVNAPKLAMRQGQLEVILDAMTILFEFVLANFMLEGQIENWCVILDLGGLGITSLPKSTLQKVMGYLSSNYRSRLYKCYVLNSPSTVMLSWSVVKAFLEDVTAQKVNFERAQQVSNIFKHCHPSQIEKKYGGTSANLESNFFWPPSVVSGNYLLETDNSEIFLKEEEYKKLYYAGKLTKNRVCQEIVEAKIQKEEKKKIEGKKEFASEQNIDQMGKNQIENDGDWEAMQQINQSSSSQFN